MKNQRSKFYLYMSYLMLGIVLLGFGPSFILRPFIEQPPMQTELDGWVIAHAIIGFLWISLYITQTTLVQANQIKLHQTLGWVGIGLALMVALSIGIVALNRPPRFEAAGWDIEKFHDFFGMIFMLDMGGIIVFSTLFTLGVVYRKQPEFHRTFILFAGLAVIGQAFPRIVNNVLGVQRDLALAAILNLVVLFLPLLNEIIYKKVRKLTIGVTIAFIAALFGFLGFGSSPVGIELAWKILDAWNGASQ